MKQENEIEEKFIALDDAPNNDSLNALFRAICMHLGLNHTAPQVSLLDPNNNNSTKKLLPHVSCAY